MIRSTIVLLALGALPVLFIAGPARAQDGEDAERRLAEIRRQIEERQAGDEEVPEKLVQLAHTVQQRLEGLRAAGEAVPEELVQQAHALQRRFEGGERSRGHGDRRPGMRRREGRSRSEDPDDQRRPRRGRPDRAGVERELENLRNEFERVQRHLAEQRERDREGPRELGESAERLQHRIRELEQVLARSQSPEARPGERFEGRRRGGEHRTGSRFGRGRAERGPDRESMRRRGPGGSSRFGRRPGNPEGGLKLFAEIAPEEAEELQRLRRENRREFFMRMREILPEMKRLAEMKEKDPEAFERTIHERHLEHRAMRLAREAREAEGDRREELVEQARKHLDELFEARMRDRDTRIEQLEHELERLRHEQEQRREQRGDLIERRLNELMGEALEF